MPSQLPSPTIVSTLDDLHKLARRLQKESLVAVDTESNSLFAYQEQVCLVQLSTRTDDWVVDPLAIGDLTPLASLFADPNIEKIFHAAEYDILCMKRDFGFIFANLFDTMVTARIIGRKTFGLAAMLEEFFGIEVNKRFQRADWSIRPIPPDQLRYAQIDTHYLPALRDILVERLQEGGHLEESREAFDWLANLPVAEHAFDPEGYWRINEARDFNRRQMAILRELYLLRDQLARRRDLPPFKIMGDSGLVKIAEAAPATFEDLRALGGGLSQHLLERQGSAILSAVQRGLHATPPTPPHRTPRLDPVTQSRYDALHDWRKARAVERGVESDVIIPKEALWALARNAPRSMSELDQIPGIGPWKKGKYGEDILHLLMSLPETEP